MAETNIFDFYDYQKYLRAFYEERKMLDANFSYRFIRNHVGIDPGYLLKIFSGKKDLTDRYIPRFALLLKLNKRETEYFELMVRFGRARSNSDIKHYFEQMLGYIEFGSHQVDADKYEFYQKWYYTAVRELVGIVQFSGDYAKLARMVEPPIKPSQAQKAVELLTRLGFIRRNEKKVFEVTSRFITTGGEWQSIAIRAFQLETLVLAQQAIEHIDKNERDISTVTISLSKGGFDKMRQALERCRKELLAIAHADSDVTRSYHVNLSMFPITKETQEGGEA